MNRIEKVLRDKEALQTNSGLVFVHPYSFVGRKAISEAYGPRRGNEDIIAVHNGRLYSTVERIRYLVGDRWQGRLAEHTVTNLCPTLETCLDTILQRYQQELADIDRLIQERWHTPPEHLLDEDIDSILAED